MTVHATIVRDAQTAVAYVDGFPVPVYVTGAAGGASLPPDGDMGDVVVGGSWTSLTVESATPADGSFNVTGSIAATAGASFGGALTVPDSAYGAGWNGSTEAPTKNAVYDQMETRAKLAGATFSGPVLVPDDAYSGTWDGSAQVPTKNAIYDKLEALAASASASADTFGFDFSTTTTAPPASQQMRLNHATPASATKIFASDLDLAGFDPTLFFNTIATGDVIVIQDKNDATAFQRFTATGPGVDMGAYHELPVAFINGGSALPNNQAAVLAIVKGSGATSDGDKGDVVVTSGVWAVESASPSDGSFNVSGDIVPTGNIGISATGHILSLGGVGAPTFTTRSTGTKIILYPEITGSSADYAFGLEASNLWFGVPQAIAAHGFKFYAGTTEVARLGGDGNVTLGDARAIFNPAGSGIKFESYGPALWSVGNAQFTLAYLQSAVTLNNPAFQYAWGYPVDTGLARSAAAVVKVTNGSSGMGDLEVADEAYGAGWNGSLEVPTKNAVYDKIEGMGGAAGVSDEAYGGTWDGVTGTAPSKNAVYDKIQSLVGGVPDGDKGEITVTAGVWAIDADVVTNTKLAPSPALSVKGNATNATSGPTDLAAGADANILRRAGTALGFGTIDLAAAGAVGTSRLLLANLVQAPALSVRCNATNALADVADVAAALDGQVFRRSGTALAFGALNLASANAITGDLPFSALTQGSALSVLGVAGNATADVASIAAASDGQVMRRSGTAIAFGAVDLASANAVTGRLPYANVVQAGALTVYGNPTNATANGADIAAGTDGHVLRRSGVTLGFGTIPTTSVAAVGANVVPAASAAGAYAELSLAASTLVGRGATGNVAACTLGATLAFTAAVLGVAKVPNAVTWNNGGAGDASGTTFDGAVARTLSWNSLGACPDAPRIQAVTSAATITPTFSNDVVNVSAQAVNLTLAAPTGTAVDGWGLVVRIKAAAAGLTIGFNAIYAAIGVTLPTTLTNGKWLYLGFIYSTAETKWHCVSVAQEA